MQCCLNFCTPRWWRSCGLPTPTQARGDRRHARLSWRAWGSAWARLWVRGESPPSCPPTLAGRVCRTQVGSSGSLAQGKVTLLHPSSSPAASISLGPSLPCPALPCPALPSPPLPSRLPRNTPAFREELDVLKFLCKDLWVAVFQKQMDGLRTNHQGTYVLQDNSFPLLVPMASGLQYLEEAPKFLAFTCGLLCGALHTLGFQSLVTASVAALPACKFQVVIQKP
ncbi:Hypothetical predicted protein [Marmota monax]|uniref:Trafficking protein particle complex subunit 6A n=1 Tax=Marmota monax TaxID=9995 RepID=A0A5E4BN83_MARMO|nr:Hypothetical predicted protein [Marmota monax]